uniref:Retrovirus-related Pol polyprotein from transposon TNT 1-94 n=1 Tax=Tanacetum cinerariifolium TaxID=118510 RepID=A0A699HK91_TANCI|nr:retrovirus-related Pol polyprotein from transposon TNT 1-94 [Tanacetum cinerariifolium]
MHDEFEMSMIGELNFFLGLQIKQIEVRIFFNQSKYIKEMLKKFGLEDSKPSKMLMSTEIKVTKDDEADSVDSFKYRENPKTTYLEAVKRIFRIDYVEIPSGNSRQVARFTQNMDVKDKQEKDKIGSKPGKTRSVAKPGEVNSSYSQESKKLKKMQIEGPELQTPTKLLMKEEKKGTRNAITSKY